MRVIEEKVVQIIKQELKVLVCNCCGEKIDSGVKEFPIDINSFHQISLDFGPRSNGYDGEKWSFDMCEECIINMVRQFKFVPNGFKEDIMESPIDNENPGLHQELFDNWKETGEWIFEYENWWNK